jgi:hypothetical protein
VFALTAKGHRAYDAAMKIARAMRPVVCVVLAVATFLGTVPAAVHACTCPTSAPQPRSSREAQKPLLSSCCERVHATAPCCAGKPGKQAPCCQPKSGLPGKSADPASCQCLLCECGEPAPRPADPTIPQQPAQSLELALAAPAPAPPVVLPLPGDFRAVPPAFALAIPPPDLVTTLSRLTC